MSELELRPYQAQAVEALRDSIRTRHRAPLLVAPCGSGKTAIAAAIIRSATDKGRKCLFLAPRRELVFQTVETLEAAGVRAGAIMAGEPPIRSLPVQVASTATLHRRTPPAADIVIVDEAHANYGAMARKILEAYPDALRIGMTATPCRSDGRGLGELYDDLVLGPSVAELTANGNLVPVRYFSTPVSGLAKVRTQAGDYHVGDLDAVMGKNTVIGDVVTNWIRLAADRITVVFAVSRGHAEGLRREFERHEVPTGYVDGETDHEERRDVLAQVHAGRVRVLCAVDVPTYGWDCPPVSCAVLARPTKSLARYLQAAGRVLRPWPAKSDCLLLDHGGCVDRLGYVDEAFPWQLDGKRKMAQEREARETREPKPIECPSCGESFRPRKTCPACGHDLSERYAKHLEVIELDLAERRRREAPPTMGEKQRFYGELLSVAATHGYRSGWVAHKYRAMYGVWPRGLGEIGALVPSLRTISWLAAQRRTYARDKARARAAS